MKISKEIIERTVCLLDQQYRISMQLTKKLIKLHGLAQFEEVLGDKLSKVEILTLLLNTVGSQFFVGSSDEVIELRKNIINGWVDDVIEKEFQKDGKTSGKSRTHKVRVLSEKKWHNGKDWPNTFVTCSKLDQVFAGIAKDGSKPFQEEVPPLIKAPKLKDFQIQLKDDLISTLNKKGVKAKCLLSLPTGGGKTRTAVEAYVEWLKPRFSEGKYLIWIAQSEELCEQAIDSVKQVWSSSEFSESLWIYRFYGKHSIDHSLLSDGGVVVCSINKLYNAILDQNIGVEQLIINCGAIIIDEAHRAVTKMYNTLYEYAQKLRGEDMFPICGLTATPGRSMDAHKLPAVFSYKLFKPNLGQEYEDNPLKFFRDKGYLATPIFISVPTGIEIDLQLDLDNPSEEDLEKHFCKKSNKELAKSKKRNRLIIDRLMKIPKSEPTIVYTCSVEHANLLSCLMNYYGRTSVSISSDTHNSLRYRYIQQFKNGEIEFIFNHSVLTTGFDAPRTQNIVICRPIFSDVLYEQIVGRGLRGVEFGGTKSCNIIDFSDTIIRYGDQRSYKRFENFWDKVDN